jgi:hypothetical protein
MRALDTPNLARVRARDATREITKLGFSQPKRCCRNLVGRSSLAALVRVQRLVDFGQ